MTSPLAPDFAAMRGAMVVSQLRPNGVVDVRLIEAMARVPREAFIPETHRAAAYIDRALPLGGGRAINPPLTTGRLIDAAEIGAGDRVLVVGAATGYALALVAALAAETIGVESDPSLAAQATANVPGARLIEGPLEAGAPDHAPYDAIIIDGAVEAVPQALIAQLAPDGRFTVAILEKGVAHLAVGRRGGNGFALTSFVDAEAVVLPGFARPRAFVFPA